MRGPGNGHNWAQNHVCTFYEGPRPLPAHARDPLYGAPAIASAWAALRAGGVLAVWAEESDRSYPLRLRDAGFTVEVDRKSTRLNSSHSGESRMPSSA